MHEVNTPRHVGRSLAVLIAMLQLRLWDSSGALLAQGTSELATGSGWWQADLPSQVFVQPGVTYTVSMST